MNRHLYVEACVRYFSVTRNTHVQRTFYTVQLQSNRTVDEIYDVVCHTSSQGGFDISAFRYYLSLKIKNNSNKYFTEGAESDAKSSFRLDLLFLAYGCISSTLKTNRRVSFNTSDFLRINNGCRFARTSHWGSYRNTYNLLSVNSQSS